MSETKSERLSDIIARLFLERGWGRKHERLRLEDAWTQCAGDEIARQTCVAGMRRGALEVIVGNSVLLQELTHFHRRTLLQKIQQFLGGMKITDLRFRIGVVR
jgi:predicted nucleic acid-binding Zn ribbon protein